MNTYLTVGTRVVVLALAAYSVAQWGVVRTRRANRRVLVAMGLGVALDLFSTVCMILGSSRGPFTLHGLLGYSALALMLVDAVWLFRFHRREGGEAVLPATLTRFSVFTYAWWLAAFVAGAALAMRAVRA